MTFGELTVVEMLYGYRYVGNKPRTYCKCIGDNGEYYTVRTDALRRGATKHIRNAGKNNKNKDISNMKFGKLAPLFATKSRGSNGSVIWCCKCDCGNECYASASNLIREHTLSCGCNKKSKWEIFISKYLDELNIEYEEGKRFSDCTNLQKTDTLPFDFYLPKENKIIEYDGEHHYNPIKGWGGEEKFKKTKENDSIKNNWCKCHDIDLLRIPYNTTKEEVIKYIDYFLWPVTITA